MKHAFFHQLCRACLLLACISISAAQAQDRYTFANANYAHNHYSTEKWLENSVVAGTVFPNDGGSNTHIMVLSPDGQILWERQYDFGQDERCLDVTVIDDNSFAITGVVSNQLFIATINSTGALLNQRTYTFEPARESIGLNIHYSASQHAFFVAGFVAEGELFATTVGTPKEGLVMRVDDQLGVEWVRFIHADHQVLANDITEIDDAGVFVTGRQSSIPTAHGALRILYDYQGNRIWERSSRPARTTPTGTTTVATNQIGANAVYDPTTDELFLVSNVYNEHTFAVEQISNASQPGANLTWITFPGDPTNSSGVGGWMGGVNLQALDIQLDPGSNQLLIAGMAEEQPNPPSGPPSSNTPTWLAQVDRNSGNVNWLRFQEVENTGYAYHDIGMLQAFSSTSGFVNFPDVLCIHNANLFQYIGYEGAGLSNAAGAINVVTTDANGTTLKAFECQQDHLYTPYPLSTSVNTTSDLEVEGTDTRIRANPLEIDHERLLECSSGCIGPGPCNLFQAHATSTCYNYYFDLPGVINWPAGWNVIQYEWVWGDGSSQITTTPAASHLFSSALCQYEVCLYITLEDTLGNTIVAYCCQNVYMLAYPWCGSCGWGQKTDLVASENRVPIRFSAYPNPASQQLTVRFEAALETGTVTLHNVLGETVLTTAIQQQQQVQLDVSGLAPGTYLLEAQTDQGRVGKPIVVE